MANAKFDSKSFNQEAFRYMVERIPNLKMNELKNPALLRAIRIFAEYSPVRTASLTRVLL